MSIEHLEILFLALVGLSLLSAAVLLLIVAAAGRAQRKRVLVLPAEWAAQPEERECQRALWTRFAAERARRRAERCRLGQRLHWNGAVRRI